MPDFKDTWGDWRKIPVVTENVAGFLYYPALTPLGVMYTFLMPTKNGVIEKHYFRSKEIFEQWLDEMNGEGNDGQ